MIEFSLSRDGMAGVCGVCGESGFPGLDDVDIEAGCTMPGTLVSWRLDELDDRCICIAEAMDSVSTWFDSFIWWNLESWATVLLVADSPFLVGSKLRSTRLLSSILRNSDMLSSSVWNEPELPPAPCSASSPEPGWATDDARL